MEVGGSLKCGWQLCLHARLSRFSRGLTRLTYTISDGEGGQDAATVSMNVDGKSVAAHPRRRQGPLTAENNPPVAIDDSATTSFETSVNGNVLANDSDPDGDAITVVSNTDARQWHGGC